MHYGIGPAVDRIPSFPYTYDQVIRNFESFVMSHPGDLYEDDDKPSVRFPTGKPDDETTFKNLVKSRYRITSAHWSTKDFVGILMAEAEKTNRMKAKRRSEAGEPRLTDNELTAPASRAKRAERASRPRSTRNKHNKHPDAARKSTLRSSKYH
jgi:hypothetical protein